MRIRDWSSDVCSSDLKAAEAGKAASIKRIRDWIALPSIAAENRSMAEGAAYMAELAKDAGFTNVEIVPTDGHQIGRATSELQSLMRISYAVFCLTKKKP